MENLLAILLENTNSLLILSGLIFIFFALFDVGKGSIRMRPGKTNFVPIVIGSVLLLGGILYKTDNSPPSQPPAAPTALPATQPPAQVTEPPAATDAAIATTVPTDVPQPTATTVVKTILDGCFASQTWTAHSINADALKSAVVQDNCLNANSLGISVEPGGKIRILGTASKAKSSSGISLPVTDQSVIEFKLTITNLYIVYPDEAAYVAFGIAPTDDPMAERGAGRFKLVVDRSGNNQTVFYYLANAEQSYGSKWPSQHPSYRKTYSIRLVLKSISMEIYVDDSKFKDEVSLPPGTKVFNIGYYLPVQAGTDISIADLTINGVAP